MSDYIKRENTIKSIKPMVGIWADDGCFYVDYQRVLDIINNEPFADVVEVVRCKDCKKRNTKTCIMNNIVGMNKDLFDDDYCSYGEKKEDFK